MSIQSEISICSITAIVKWGGESGMLYQLSCLRNVLGVQVIATGRIGHWAFRAIFAAPLLNVKLLVSPVRVPSGNTMSD